MRLIVRMPTVGAFSINGRMGIGPVEQPIETMVDGLRRQEFKGQLADDYVFALAFAPETYRSYLRERGRLVGEDHVWCIARVADNKKSLAPFFASGDVEWDLTEAE